jgi:hypothetical protein
MIGKLIAAAFFALILAFAAVGMLAMYLAWQAKNNQRDGESEKE